VNRLDQTPARDPSQRPKIRQVMVTGVGLQIPDSIAFDAWEQVGHKIANVVNCSAWCLGDWLVYGQYKYAERYRRVVATVNLDYQTLRNYAWVARRFDLERRRPQLSFQHHAEVAAAGAQDQDRWLDLAEAGRWSRNELRRNVRAERTGAGAGATASAGRSVMAGPGEGDAALPRLAIEAERVARWRDAAKLAGRALDEWIVTTLDANADAAFGT
jgi:hypothetical protein